MRFSVALRRGWPQHARKEPRHVIGFLSGHSDAIPVTLAAFYQSLKETGFVERKNLGIEFRWAGVGIRLWIAKRAIGATK